MKKYLVFALIGLTVFACKKKEDEDDDGGGNGSATYSIEFSVFTREFETDLFKEGALIKIATSQANLDNNILVDSLNTDVNGTALKNDLEKTTYYYRITYEEGGRSYDEEGTITFTNSGIYVKNALLKQYEGPTKAMFRVSQGGSLRVGAQAGISYDLGTFNQGTYLLTSNTNASGIVTFESLKTAPDTVYVNFKDTINSTPYNYNISILINTEDRSPYYDINL